MALVVDTSVVIATVLNEPHRGQILAVTAGHELVTSRSIDWEIGNAFSAMFRRGSLELNQAAEALVLYRSIPLRRIDVSVEASVVIAHRHRIYAYDAYMIQAAIETGLPLVTLDQKLLSAARLAKIECVEVMP